MSNMYSISGLKASLNLLVKQRISVLVIILLFLVIGLGWTQVRSQYSSTGFIQLGGSEIVSLRQGGLKGYSRRILFEDYKKMSRIYGAEGRFVEFVQSRRGQLGADYESILKEARNVRVTESVLPVFRFSKLDARMLLTEPTERGSDLLGLELKVVSSSADQSKKMISVLSDYILDSILYFEISDAALKGLIFNEERLVRMESEVSELEAGITGLQEKLREMKRIEGHSLLSQSIELQLLEDRFKLRSAATVIGQSEVLIDYYEGIRGEMADVVTGAQLLEQLDKIASDASANKGAQGSADLEAAKLLAFKNKYFKEVLLKRNSLIAGPSDPVRVNMPLGRAVILSLITGVLVSLLSVFGYSWFNATLTKY